jgi:acetyl-CoA carboxylase biotin carboxylase subunit
MFQKILVANRGEIAVRILRACKQMGIETVAIYSEADRTSLHVQIADESVCVGGAKSVESYLNMENIITAAIATGAEAIHPGFGFLSENARFADLCRECGIVFIGPSSHAIDGMGNKSKARQTMIAAGVPVVPGSEGAIASLEAARELAEEIGYPVLIKASAGGGGRGMRVAYTKEEFPSAFQTAKSEAKIAFGDDTMYLEKFLIRPRHIEFQILADKYGNVVHLGERDCSIQRRNQKVLEEAPSNLSSSLREAMAAAAITAARAVQYENAGTVEFLVNGDAFYFIEMNTRIQVEHPVTEMITGIDIIQEQIRIASGMALSFTQEDVVLRGHSIEIRINAEDPRENFRPSPGTVSLLHVPSGHGIRFDSMLYAGYSIPPHYDSMMGKLIVHAPTRDEAIKKMLATLDEFVIEGVPNNRRFCERILRHEQYQKGVFDTGFIAANLDRLVGYESHE